MQTVMSHFLSCKWSLWSREVFMSLCRGSVYIRPVQRQLQLLQLRCALMMLDGCGSLQWPSQVHVTISQALSGDERVSLSFLFDISQITSSILLGEYRKMPKCGTPEARGCVQNLRIWVVSAGIYKKNYVVNLFDRVTSKVTPKHGQVGQSRS